jgi:hypothetical protein
MGNLVKLAEIFGCKPGDLFWSYPTIPPAPQTVQFDTEQPCSEKKRTESE